MEIKYGLIGFNGRLAKEVFALFAENNFKCALKIDKDLFEQTELPEVIVDCSLPEAFDQTLDLVKKSNVPLIIATTGLNDKQITELKILSKKVPIVQSFNFSIGIQVMLKLIAQAAEIFSDADVEILETHHRFKKDKPSGTALMLKEELLKFNLQNEINVSSLRLGNIAGEHSVSFGQLGEVLEINHKAISRRTFAEGILKSVKFILSAEPKLYSFTEVIFGDTK